MNPLIQAQIDAAEKAAAPIKKVREKQYPEGLRVVFSEPFHNDRRDVSITPADELYELIQYKKGCPR